MKICHKCGASNQEQLIFCSQCGAMLENQQPAPEMPMQQVEPVGYTVPEVNETYNETQVLSPDQWSLFAGQQMPVEEPVKKSKKGLVIGIAVGATLLVGAAVAGVLFLKSTPNKPAQNVEESVTTSQSDNQATTLKGRIETARSEFAAGTKDYTAFQAELDDIERLGEAEVAEDIAAAREYGTRINDSREAFSAAEALFGEEKYLEAANQYDLVVEEDSNYETAISKGAECVNKYREKVLADAAACVDQGDDAGAIALLETALEKLQGDTVLQEQLSIYSACDHVYEDGRCKDCEAVDESYEGLMKAADGSWYYARGGQMDASFTGLCKRNGFFYYVKDGKLDWEFTGLAKYDGVWYYMVKGELANTFTGLVEHSVTMFYVKNGKVDNSFTGLYKQNDIWYYVEKGEHKRAYTGLCRHGDDWYYVSNGKLDRSYSGTYQKDGISYNIQNGVVQ